jgi:hypothetical protein
VSVFGEEEGFFLYGGVGGGRRGRTRGEWGIEGVKVESRYGLG